MASRITVKSKVKRNKVFKEISRSKKRYRIYKGGAGSGKSTEIAIALIKKLSNEKYCGCNLMCIRKVEATNRDSTFAELKKAANAMFGEKIDLVWEFSTGRTTTMYARCLLTDCEIMFRGVYNEKDIEKLKSITFTTGKLTDVWIEEASEITENDFNIIDDRLRGELADGLFYQINLSFNPVLSWVKARFFDLPDDNAIICESTYLDNRFIDDAYHDRMMTRKERDPRGYQIYGKGDWGTAGGEVFKNIVDYEFTDEDFKHFRQVDIGLDWGATNDPTCVIWCYYDSRNKILNIYDEIYEYGIMEDALAIKIREKNYNNTLIIADSAWTMSNRNLSRQGINVTGAKKGPHSIEHGVKWLQNLKEIRIDTKRCSRTMIEFKTFAYLKDKEGNYIDRYTQDNNHTVDAVRYAMETYSMNNNPIGMINLRR